MESQEKNYLKRKTERPKEKEKIEEQNNNQLPLIHIEKKYSN